MTGRSVETILEDWRACERELEIANEDIRALIEERIESIGDELAMAVAIREANATYSTPQAGIA
jgi:hypothetical protein